MNATDNESGVNATYYKINENGWIKYLQPFFIEDCGINILQFYSIDNIGNVEETKQVEIKIDCYPPILYYYLDPPVPDGLNGWYISCVTVTLNATDNESGVDHIYCNRSPGGNYTEPIIISEDGAGIPVEFGAVDKVGNEEIPHHSLNFDIDKTDPMISLSYEVVGGNAFKGWDLCFTATANDGLSGMNRVEFYINNVLQETVSGSGPTYKWVYHLFFQKFMVRGFILNPEITDEYVKFFAMLVIILGLVEDLPTIRAYAYDNAGNYAFDETSQPSSIAPISPGIYLFKYLKLPNNYEGEINKFFIKANFYS